MQNNKYIANAPVQMPQTQRIAMVNQGVRANMINFQAAPSAPAKVDGDTKIDKVKTWATKWGPLVFLAVLVGAKKFSGETTNKTPAPVVKGRFGKK